MLEKKSIHMLILILNLLLMMKSAFGLAQHCNRSNLISYKDLIRVFNSYVIVVVIILQII